MKDLSYPTALGWSCFLIILKQNIKSCLLYFDNMNCDILCLSMILSIQQGGFQKT